MTEKLQLVGYDGEKTRIVHAHATRSPHFVLTKSLVHPGCWNVTHKYSTAIVCGPFVKKRTAEYVAAIFDSIPMPWDKFNPHVAMRGDSIAKRYFRDMWLKVPEELRNWTKTIRESCVVVDVVVYDEAKKLKQSHSYDHV